MAEPSKMDIETELSVLQTLILRQVSQPEPDVNRVRTRLSELLQQLKFTPRAQKALRTYSNLVLTTLSTLAEEDAEPTRVLKARLAKGYDDALHTIQELWEVEKTPASDEAYLEADSKTLASFRSQANNLRSGVSRGGIFYGQAPLVTMLALNRSSLTAAGIPFTTLGGYTVLLNQHVLGVSHQFVEAQLERELEDTSSEVTKSLKRLRSPDSMDKATGEAGLKIAQHAVEVFLARNRHFDLLGDTGYPWNSARWFWLFDKKLTPKLRGAAFGDKAKGLSRWGFAFESKERIQRIAGTGGV